MKLIEDLGLLEYGNQGKKKRFGLYECPICRKTLRCAISGVTGNKITKCRTCANNATNKAKSKDTARSFIWDAMRIHGSKYLYILVDFISDKTKVQIICPTHGSFWQTPNKHKGGRGCPECNSIALRMYVSSGKPTILYYVYFKEYNLWKIGCTNKDIESRFRWDKTPIEILGAKTYEDSREAYFVEGWVLKATLGDKTVLKPLKNGNTELRIKPIDNLLWLMIEAEGTFKNFNHQNHVL